MFEEHHEHGSLARRTENQSDRSPLGVRVVSRVVLAVLALADTAVKSAPSITVVTTSPSLTQRVGIGSLCSFELQP